MSQKTTGVRAAHTLPWCRRHPRRRRPSERAPRMVNQPMVMGCPTRSVWPVPLATLAARWAQTLQTLRRQRHGGVTSVSDVEVRRSLRRPAASRRCAPGWVPSTPSHHHPPLLGSGHIAANCPSTEHDSRICHTCKGKGHLSSHCPNNVPSGICFRCRQPGHQQRDCPLNHGGGYGRPGFGE